MGQTMSNRVWGEGGVKREEDIKMSSNIEGGELHDEGVCVEWWPTVALRGIRLQEERKEWKAGSRFSMGPRWWLQSEPIIKRCVEGDVEVRSWR